MLTTEDPNTIEYTSDESVSSLETRFSIVCDAVGNDRSHQSEAVDQFLTVFHDSLAEHPVTQAGDTPLDDRIVNALDEMMPLRNYFVQFVNVVCQSENSNKIHIAIRKVLGRSLAYKHAPRDVIHFNHLWCDHYRFLLRELFLTVIALLIRNRKYDEVNDYLDAEYSFKTSRGPETTTFLGFDSYIKTLDEFRMRRMRKTRLSAAADYLRERSDLDFVSFDDIMQADFVMCMRGMLHHPQALTRWFPRTLVHAGKFEERGFNIFSAAMASNKFAPVAAVLKVKNQRELEKRFAEVSRQCRLGEWKLGSAAIPFESYLALN